MSKYRCVGIERRFQDKDRLEVPQGGSPMDPIGEQWGVIAGNDKLAYQWLQELSIEVSSDRYITDTLSSA
jgi:hypothetical protein